MTRYSAHFVTSARSQDCGFTIDSTLEERKSTLKKRKKKGASFQYLKPGHLATKCRVLDKCVFCKGKHYPILYSNTSHKRDAHIDNDKACEISMFSNSHSNLKETCLQTLVVNAKNGNQEKKNPSRKGWKAKVDTIRLLILRIEHSVLYFLYECNYKNYNRCKRLQIKSALKQSARYIREI